MRAAALAGAVAAAVALALYAYRIGDAPPYVGLDEAHFANHAYSIATTGRDLSGNRLPLFIALEDPLGDKPSLPWGTTWYHPLGFYLIASVLTVAPLTEWAIRLPFAIAGVLNVVLIYLVVRRWHGHRMAAAGAALLLAMTPAHFILGRLALDYLLPLPFILLWLYCLAGLLREPSRIRAACAGLVLGAGCFSYVSSWLMMPVYAIVTAAALCVRGRRGVVALAVGFMLPIALLAPWVAFHPEMPGNIIAQYQAGEGRRSMFTAVASGSGVTAAARDAVAAYWSYFDPSFLLVYGGSSRLVSTGAVGVWPIGLVVLLAAGLMRIVRQGWTAWHAILLAGFFLAPLPAALKGEPFAIQRAVALLPFGALIATEGLVASMAHSSRVVRVAVLVAIASVPLQFSGFLRDYFGGYQPSAARALDPTAFRETASILVSALEHGGVEQVALTTPLYDVSAKWRFYCTKNGREDLLSRTRYFGGDVAELNGVPAGSFAVVESAAFAPRDGWTLVSAPESLSGERPLTLLRRQ